jgi:hypothetical protein
LNGGIGGGSFGYFTKNCHWSGKPLKNLKKNPAKFPTNFHQIQTTVSSYKIKHLPIKMRKNFLFYKAIKKTSKVLFLIQNWRNIVMKLFVLQFKNEEWKMNIL